MLLLKLLTNLKTTCVVCARFKASKTVLLVRRIENAFFQIRQETLKGRYLHHDYAEARTTLVSVPLVE